MATKQEKNEIVRNQIIEASHVYRDQLAGKVFLYVYGNSCFEVVFQTDRFMHLTGVNSLLRAQDFYSKAKTATLTTEQFFYDSKHPYDGAKKKLSCLKNLPLLTNSLVCVLKDMNTMTLTYKLGVTNLDFTIGLTENIDRTGKKINEWYLPRTLRVKDASIEKSKESEFIDFIFTKSAADAKYSIITYRDSDKTIPASIHEYLSPTLLKQIKPFVKYQNVHGKQELPLHAQRTQKEQNNRVRKPVKRHDDHDDR